MSYRVYAPTLFIGLLCHSARGSPVCVSVFCSPCLSDWCGLPISLLYHCRFTGLSYSSSDSDNYVTPKPLLPSFARPHRTRFPLLDTFQYRRTSLFSMVPYDLVRCVRLSDGRTETTDVHWSVHWAKVYYSVFTFMWSLKALSKREVYISPVGKEEL